MIRRAHSQAERQKVLDTAQLLQERPQLAGSGPSPRRPITRVVPDLGSASRSTPFNELERSTGTGPRRWRTARKSGPRNGVFSLCCWAVSSQLHPYHWLPACPSASQPVSTHVWRRPPTRTNEQRVIGSHRDGSVSSPPPS